jgi:hypothetical protein
MLGTVVDRHLSWGRAAAQVGLELEEPGFEAPAGQRLQRKIKNIKLRAKFYN